MAAVDAIPCRQCGRIGAKHRELSVSALEDVSAGELRICACGAVTREGRLIAIASYEPHTRVVQMRTPRRMRYLGRGRFRLERAS